MRPQLKIRIKGKEYTLTELAEKTGVVRQTLYTRYRTLVQRGEPLHLIVDEKRWDTGKAVYFNVDGQEYKLIDIAKKTKRSRTAILYRIQAIKSTGINPRLVFNNDYWDSRNPAEDIKEMKRRMKEQKERILKQTAPSSLEQELMARGIL